MNLSWENNPDKIGKLIRLTIILENELNTPHEVKTVFNYENERK